MNNYIETNKIKITDKNAWLKIYIIIYIEIYHIKIINNKQCKHVYK